MGTTAKDSKAKTKQDKPEVKTEIKKANVDVASQQIIVRKEMKYIYPKGCILPEQRKSYRAKVRNKITNLNARIAKLRGEERRILKAELAEYEAQHLVVSN